MSKVLWGAGAITYLCALLLFGMGTNSPNPVRWTVLALLVAASLACLIWRTGFKANLLTSLVALFVAYAGLTLLWSPDWKEGLIRFQSLALLCGLYIALIHADRKQLEALAPVVAATAILISFIVSYYLPITHGGLGNVNFQSEFMVILSPLCFMGWRNRWGAYCVPLGLLAIGIALTNSSSAELAGFAGVAALIAAAYCSRFILVLVAAVFVGLVAVYPALLYSAMYRLEFVINTLAMWADNPVFGVGMGGFNWSYPQYQEFHTQWISPGTDGTALHNVANFVGAAHNEFIQALATFGVIGCLLLIGTFAVALKSPQNRYALASLAATAGLSLIGFPFQNPATAVAIVMSLALCSPSLKPRRLSLPSKLMASAALVPIVVAVGVFNVNAVKAERYFTQTQLWNAIDPLKGLVTANKAHSTNPFELRYRIQLIVSLEHLSTTRKNVIVKPSAADRAYRVSASAAPLHQAVLVSRAQYLMNSGRWEDGDEIKEIIGNLKRFSSTHGETWLIIAYYNGLVGDTSAAAKSLVMALERGARVESVTRIAKQLNMEITRQ